MPSQDLEHLLRDCAPQVLVALLRRHGNLDDREDAVQEALLVATSRWPRDGQPADPVAWLVTTAHHKLIDQWRRDTARTRRELRLAAQQSPPVEAAGQASAYDDIVDLLVLCCHPALTSASQVALTLRAVGGLSTAQIARAYLIPETTMAQRISRAKRAIKESGGRFETPVEARARISAVLHVLYLMFNEGYTTTGGEALGNTELAQEAIRITRLLHRAAPNDRDATALLALMLLTESRRSARTDSSGHFVPLEEQDRDLWDTNLIREGIELTAAAACGIERPGAYQLQAAIAALHAEAPTCEDTDWAQILILYQLLEHTSANPVTTLNRAVATAMVHGPMAGLAVLDQLDATPLATHPRTHAVRGHLLDRLGDPVGARREFLAAAHDSLSVPEQRYLRAKAAGLATK